MSLLISHGYDQISCWLVYTGLVNFRSSTDGKSGLEVLLMIVEKSLSPSIEESQRMLAGPLIADLLQKVCLNIEPTNVGESSNATSLTHIVKRYHNTSGYREITGVYSGLPSSIFTNLVAYPCLCGACHHSLPLGGSFILFRPLVRGLFGFRDPFTNLDGSFRGYSGIRSNPTLRGCIITRLRCRCTRNYGKG